MDIHNLWSRIVDCLRRTSEIRYWSVAGRTRASSFRILNVNDFYVEVQPESGGVQRIPRRDFELVLEVWDGYKSGRVKRCQLRDLTRFSSYIISIIHHCLKSG